MVFSYKTDYQGIKMNFNDEILKDFITLEPGWSNVSKEVFMARLEGRKVDGSLFYSVGLDDIYDMLVNARNAKYKTGEIAFGWWENVKYTFYNNLGLDILFPDGPQNISHYRMNDVPDTNEEMLKWVLHHLSLVFDDILTLDGPYDFNEFAETDRIIEAIDQFWDDEIYELNEISPLLMKDFIFMWDNDLLLKDSDEYTRDLFRTFTDTLAKSGDFDALKIKAYACYGGNSVYKCNWKESAKCLEKLWRDFSFGYAANTLGYIYYYGRLTDGVPDYEKAFFYYSIGSTYEITESKYKLADMFIKGQYVAKNVPLGKHIIEKLYSESRYHYELGEPDTNFADIALRMGNLQLEEKGSELYKIFAYKYYLQAEFALKHRMKNRDFWGDRTVEKNIAEAIAKVKDVVKHYKATYKAQLPFNIFDLINARGYCMYELHYKRLKNNRIKLNVTRKSRGEDIEESIITYPQFACCEMNHETSVIAEDVKIFDLTIEDCGVIFFDAMNAVADKDGKEIIVFYCDNVPILKIDAESYRISKPKNIS